MNDTVLFVIGSLARGGAETQLLRLASGLHRRGWGCKVFALEARGELRNELAGSGIQILDGGFRSDQSRPRRLLGLCIAMLKLIVCCFGARKSVMHAFLPLTNFMGAIAGRLCFMSMIITSRRALGTHQERHPSLAWMDRIANSLSDVITVNSDAVAYDMKERDGVNLRKVARIYNGIDIKPYLSSGSARTRLRREYDVPESGRVILNVANLIEYKGQFELIRAFSRVHACCRDTRLWIAGDDRGILSSLMELAKDLAVSDAVEFLGARNDIPELLAICDLFVLPSHEEGFSNSLLEALAVGAPVVATDVGGNAEALNHGEYGVLVPPRDVDSLAEAMISVLDMEHEIPSVGSQRWVSENFTLDAMIQRHEDIYRAGGKGNPAPLMGVDC